MCQEDPSLPTAFAHATPQGELEAGILAVGGLIALPAAGAALPEAAGAAGLSGEAAGGIAGDITENFANGGVPKASDLEGYALKQGWTKSQTETGPAHYLDENGMKRLTLKQGSGRTPGSEDPHAEMRNESGNRIDSDGNEVTRRSPGNHSPIEWDW
jgi:hypothetical protein